MGRDDPVHGTDHVPRSLGRSSLGPIPVHASFLFLFLVDLVSFACCYRRDRRLGLDCRRLLQLFSGPPSSSNFDAESLRPALTLQRCCCETTPFCYQLTAMTTKKPTATLKIPSQCQSQFELAGSPPAVSLDPRDYFYPSSIQGPSVWSIRMEQELVKAVSMTKVLPATSLLSDEPYSTGGTVPFPSQSRSYSILLHNWRAARGIGGSCGRPNLALT